MHWNHRVVRIEYFGEQVLAFAEVNYGDGGEPESYDTPPYVVGDDMEELRELVGRLALALEEPVLDVKELATLRKVEEHFVSDDETLAMKKALAAALAGGDRVVAGGAEMSISLVVSPEEIAALRFIANAAHAAGPGGLTMYFVKPGEIKALGELLDRNGFTTEAVMRLLRNGR